MKTIKNLAPIVLFVYNRPWHTQQTLEALKNNLLAKDSILYIYADGQKKDADNAAFLEIEKTRNIIKKEQWCKEVNIIEASENKGLADSIVSGVTEIVNKYGKVIVLEDDIVTSPFFLKYMNDALNLYNNESKVMHISAFVPLTQGANKLPETYFLSFMSCWGWATWKRAWNNLIIDTPFLYNKIKKHPELNHFNVDNSINMFDQLEKNNNGQLHTWAIKWYSSIFLEKGLCLYPKISLTKNIGFDGSGTNCGKDEKSQIQHLNLDTSIQVQPIKIEENKTGFNYLKRFYLYGNEPTIKNKIFHLIEKSRFLMKLYYLIK